MSGLLKFGRSIREFQNNSNQNVFNDAETYPVFFQRHLVHPSRRLKVFLNDPNANIRAFYFQYLILLFEVQNKNFDFYIQKLNNFIVDPDFSFIFLQSDDETIFNDQQFKRFFIQFLEILQSGEFLTVEQALNKYPIADIVLVYFFRSLLIYAQLTNDFEEYLDKNALFGFLLQNFRIDAAVYEETCLKFFQAEVFVYEESPYEIYMAYMEIDNQNSSNLQKSEEQSSRHSINLRENIIKDSNFQEMKVQKSEIISESESKYSSSINQKISILEDYNEEFDSENKFEELGNFRKQKQKQKDQYIPHQFQEHYVSEKHQESLYPTPKIQQTTFPSSKYQNLITENIYQSQVEIQKRTPSSPSLKHDQHLQSTTYRTSRATTIQNRDVPSVPISVQKNFSPAVIQQPIVYVPHQKTAGRQIRTDSKASESSFKKSLMKKLNISNEFTDSQTLMKISEPYRSNIKNIKSRSRQYRESLVRTIK